MKGSTSSPLKKSSVRPRVYVDVSGLTENRPPLPLGVMFGTECREQQDCICISYMSACVFADTEGQPQRRHTACRLARSLFADNICDQEST